MTTPPEGPDREALAEYLASMDRAGGGIYTADFRDGFRHALAMLAAQESGGEREPVREAAREALARQAALLPTPPAPGAVTEADYQGAEDPFADPPAPGDPNDPDPEPYTGWQLLHDGYGNLAAVPPAPGGGEGLRAAAEKRLLHGHNDTCDMAMDKAAGPSFQGYACTCGHDDLTAALAARDTDQGAGDALAEAAKHMLRTVEGRAWRMTPYDSDTETRCSSLVGPDEPCGECIPCWTYNVTKAAAALRAALARATPEADQ
jgi:hypothetical protein